MTNTDLMNVGAFKGRAPSAAFAVLNPQTESLADGIGASYGILGYKGKVWSLRHRGEKYVITRPDDGTPAAFLDVIILRSASYKSKSYYAGTYQDGQDGLRPTCSALDGVTPDPDILTPQCASCAICPRNVFGVNAEGRKTKDCGDYKRLAVLLLPSVTSRILGAPLMEPVFLRVPAASLNDLAAMGEAMAQQGYHYSTFITRIGFQADKAHPQMTFKALQELADAEAPIVLPMREDPQALRITGENEVGKPRAVAGPASQAQQQLPANNVVPMRAAPQTVVQPAQTQTAPTPTTTPPSREPETVDTGFGGVAQQAGPKPGANVVIEATANPAQAGQQVVEAGFGNLGQTTQVVAAPATAPTANTVEDTGAPEESDVDLDARVAALLQR